MTFFNVRFILLLSLRWSTSLSAEQQLDYEREPTQSGLPTRLVEKV